MFADFKLQFGPFLLNSACVRVAHAGMPACVCVRVRASQHRVTPSVNSMLKKSRSSAFLQTLSLINIPEH